MLTVYGTDLCIDCVLCKLNFDRYGISYRFIDITSSIKNLKEFLKIRDKEAIFETCKQRGGIGLPTLMREDGTYFFGWEDIVVANGFEVIEDVPSSSCSLDGSGC